MLTFIHADFINLVLRSYSCHTVKPPYLSYLFSCPIAYFLSGYPLIVEGVTLGNLLPNILGDNRDKCFCDCLCADIFTADYHLHWCFRHDTLSLFICFLILTHT